MIELRLEHSDDDYAKVKKILESISNKDRKNVLINYDYKQNNKSIIINLMRQLKYTISKDFLKYFHCYKSINYSFSIQGNGEIFKYKKLNKIGGINDNLDNILFKSALCSEQMCSMHQPHILNNMIEKKKKAIKQYENIFERGDLL